MATDAPIVVTGALSYSGREVARRLLARGRRVRTLTNSPDRPNPFGEALEVHPLAFDDPSALARSMEGAGALINTYWVRFNRRGRGRGGFTHASAVANTRALFRAACEAGVRHVVHVSILNPGGGRGLTYYDGKAELEDAVARAGLECYEVVRPGVLFGRGDILVNNIAWALRRMPVFGVFGDGRYALRPMHVDDFADLLVDRALAPERGRVTDAVGPERFTYEELVRLIAHEIGVRRPIVRMPETLGWAITKALDPIVGDVIVTRQEVEGLTRNLRDSLAESTGSIRLSDYVREHASTLGTRYASEVIRRLDPRAACGQPR